MPGIIDLPKFNYEDLEEIVCRWTGFIWSLLVTPLLLLFIPCKFLVRMLIKFRITKEKVKEEDTIKWPQQNV